MAGNRFDKVQTKERPEDQVTLDHLPLPCALCEYSSEWLNLTVSAREGCAEAREPEDSKGLVCVKCLAYKWVRSRKQVRTSHLQ
jgi:hypothetical protein